MAQRYKIGDRIGTIMKAEGDTIWLFGYGTYQGDQIPDPSLNVLFLGSLMDHPNPCILLDSGKQVFGCECWWGPEEQIQKKVAPYKNVMTVDIEEARKL